MPIALRFLVSIIILMVGVAASSAEDAVIISDTRTGTIERLLDGHNDWITSVEYSSDGDRLLTSSSDQTVRIWDAATGDELLNINTGAQVLEAIFSPDDSTILVLVCTERDSSNNCSRGALSLWDADTGDAIHTLEDLHREAIYALAFSPDGAMMATGGCATIDPATSRCSMGEILLWDAAIQGIFYVS